MTAVTLQTSRDRWANWKRFSLSLSMDALAGSFEFIVSDSERTGALFDEIGAGQEVSIFFDDTEMFAGFVDSHSVTLSGAGTHDVSIIGRTLGADLVDSSAVHKTRVFKKKDPIAIIKEITGDFDIDVQVQSGLSFPAIDEFKFTLGDTVFDVIDRLGTMAGFVALPARRGILLTRVATERSRFQLGEFKEADVIVDHSGLFSEYRVIGEKNGYDLDDPKAAAIITGTATDGLVKRHRPLIVQQENAATTETVETHAKWLKTRHNAAAASMSCLVKDFKNLDGQFHELNQRTWVNQPALGLNREMLINEITFIQDGQSATSTRLAMVNPSLYDPDPKPAKNTKSASSGSSYFDL